MCPIIVYSTLRVQKQNWGGRGWSSEQGLVHGPGRLLFVPPHWLSAFSTVTAQVDLCSLASHQIWPVGSSDRRSQGGKKKKLEYWASGFFPLGSLVQPSSYHPRILLSPCCHNCSLIRCRQIQHGKGAPLHVLLWFHSCLHPILIL